MKALLLKDWYMMTKYCRSYLLIAAVFIAVTFFTNDDMFFIFYPCILCGMIPVNLMSYDEQSGWLKYSAALPYSKLEIVTSKYLIGLMSQGVMLIATGIAQAVKMSLSGVFDTVQYLVIMLLVLLLSALSSAVSLPFIFKYGTEKGRIIYFVMVGFMCALAVICSALTESINLTGITPAITAPLFAIAVLGLYLLSWYLSYCFFKKREL